MGVEQNRKKIVMVILLIGIGAAYWFSSSGTHFGSDSKKTLADGHEAPANSPAPPHGKTASNLSKDEVSQIVSTGTSPSTLTAGSEKNTGSALTHVSSGTAGAPSSSTTEPGTSSNGMISQQNQRFQAGAPAVSLPGMPAGQGLAQPAVQKQLAAEPVHAPVQAAPQMQGCYSVTLSHKKMPSHADGEACLKHKNLLTLQGPEPIDFKKLNSDSICVRVNGDPVSFQKVPGQSNQVVIGAVAGPDAKIVASFCLGKSKCSERCVVKRDEFMSALGMDDMSGDGKAGWDGSKGASKEDTELEAEVVAFNRERDGMAGAGIKDEMFSGWVAEKSTLACVAQAGVQNTKLHASIK